MKFDEGKFTRPVNGYEHVEFAFGSLHLRKVDTEEVNRVALELPLRLLLSPDIRQPGKVVALQSAMQG